MSKCVYELLKNAYKYVFTDRRDMCECVLYLHTNIHTRLECVFYRKNNPRKIDQLTYVGDLSILGRTEYRVLSLVCLTN